MTDYHKFFPFIFLLTPYPEAYFPATEIGDQPEALSVAPRFESFAKNASAHCATGVGLRVTFQMGAY